MLGGFVGKKKNALKTGEITFVNDTSFVVTQKIDEVELTENDNLTVLSSKEKITTYTISKKGKINGVENKSKK